MEKTPAASAMDWTIRLQKSLRSNSPIPKSIEALTEIGKNLERWDRDAELKPAEYRIFGLIPGEDKLFLNSIFLRLVDALRFGNKEVKKAVVRVFLGIVRKRRGRRGGGEGILSRRKLENYLELLRRVKGVFDGGDSEERALALVLFGCWAGFAEECPDVRYVVLSSLVSGDVVEVKAALFAAGCLSELSDDFGIVFLEILTPMVTSDKISRGVKLAAGRAFAKLWCSSLLADKAYKTGAKLLMDSSEDDFSAVMLVSVSRIASRWMMLIPNQMKLISVFLSEDKSLNLQATSLRCLRLLLAREVCNVISDANTVHKLFGILCRSESSPRLQLEALKTLHKVLMYNIAIIPCEEMPDLFVKLLTVVKNMEHSSIVPTRVLAVDTLTDLSVKLLGRQDVISAGIGSSLAVQLISFVLDHILLLVTPKATSHKSRFAPEHEVGRLFSLLFNLARTHSFLHTTLLNNMCLFIDKLMKMLDKVKDVEKNGLSNSEISKYISNSESLFASKVMLCASKVLAACMQNFEDTSAETCQILDKLKLQLENVCHCNYFDNYTTMTYFLLLRLRLSMQHMEEEFLSRNLKRDINSTNQLDEFNIDAAKRMLEKKCYWSCYKAGKMAACQGAWSTASFIFEQLMPIVKSTSTSSWLKSLALFATSEKQIQYLFLREQGTLIVPPESTLNRSGGISSKVSWYNNVENLLEPCKTLVSAERLLAVCDMSNEFSFQRWFLSLRVKFLKTVGDIMKPLDNSSFLPDGSGLSRRLERSILTSSHRLDYLINYSNEVSYKMKKLAQEYDLLLSSFLDIKTQSRMIVSTLALSCSLIAFAAGFAFLRPNFMISGNTEEPFHALLIADLIGRLKPIDVETRKNFLLLLKLFPKYKSCSMTQLQSQVSTSSCDARVLHKLCASSVKEILTLQNDASKVQIDGDATAQNAGFLLLLNLVSELMFIPFQTPYRFFQVRSSTSSKLFVMNEDGENVDGISVLPGFHLCLSLCLQLKNISTNLLGPQRKVYCILKCEKNFDTTTKIEGQDHLGWKDQEMVDMLDLNEQLLRHVVGAVGRPRLNCRGHADECLMLGEYVCFQLNERGQGFSNCLLDVSGFPVGCYQIKWHSGFLDNRGYYWSLFPLNSGLLFTVQDVKPR